MIVDGSNNVRVSGTMTASGGQTVSAIADVFESSGDLEKLTDFPTKGQIAADSSGNTWAVYGTVPGELSELPVYSTGSILTYNTWNGGPNTGGTSGIYSIVDPKGIAVDGAGTLWIANKGNGASTSDPTSGAPNLTEVIPSELSSYNRFLPLVESRRGTVARGCGQLGQCLDATRKQYRN